ncbi:hypothetical protein WMF26_05480 [Sorangium sp. So ce185]|uniref:hypothetical protein n=1 Tax=Sorangium sp. So ce185 TaxID=3133287 RepID=UPI003F6368FC
MTLYLGPAEDQGPEANESLGEAIWFDRRDPRSIRRAQEILQDRLRLSVAPTLCDEPSPGLGAALGRLLAALVSALERWHRRNADEKNRLSSAAKYGIKPQDIAILSGRVGKRA